MSDRLARRGLLCQHVFSSLVHSHRHGGKLGAVALVIGLPRRIKTELRAARHREQLGQEAQRRPPAEAALHEVDLVDELVLPPALQFTSLVQVGAQCLLERDGSGGGDLEESP